MFGMAMNSAKQFFAGKLFKDNRVVFRQLALGAGAGLVVGLVLGQIAPLWLAAIAAGAVAGIVQPILLKDVKYA
jgi:predicted lysophospholipase L1 biosynthesis ABC-type transport system permease subunit